MNLFTLQNWSTSHWMIGLIVTCLLVLTPGFFSIPPVDRDETRFSHSTRQMVATGTFIDIPFQDGKRYKKPIGIYWLQGAAVNAYGALTGKTADAPIWVHRLPSIVGIVAAILATFWVARAFLTPFGAGVASFLLAVSILPGVEARIAKTDGFLLFIILLAQGVLARAWLSDETGISRRLQLLFWACVGIGVLIKGPIILLVSGLTVGALSIIDCSPSLIKKLKPLSGVLIFLVIAAPWFIAIGFISKGDFYVEAGLVDFLGKVASVQESHGGIPGLYAAVMIGTFWPSSLVLLAAFPFLLKHWNARPVLFAIAWVVPSWLVFEFTPTKLPHYVLPLYPALALGVGYAIQNVWYVSKLWQKILTSLLFIVPAILGAVAFGGLVYLEDDFQWAIIVLTLFAVLCGFVAWRILVREKQLSHCFPWLALCCCMTYLAVFQFGFPNLQSIWISNRMVSALDDYPPSASCPSPSVIVTGYSEPSLAFLGPLDMRFYPAEKAVDLIKAAPCRRLFMTDRQKDIFEKTTAPATGLPPLTPLAVVKGITLNGGKNITVRLYKIEGEAE